MRTVHPGPPVDTASFPGPYSCSIGPGMAVRWACGCARAGGAGRWRLQRGVLEGGLGGGAQGGVWAGSGGGWALGSDGCDARHGGLMYTERDMPKQ